ncbi:hypothetical protein [Neobacillus citreus]|uniref:Uncharacterized protein n=1 Tax=Neobacillus citreus TaxID=2833578 RepID=A0A942YDG6_9BACI|nr:hypothetical protein [Neobacillus citreus]MCH6269363.1 hypothetical protein [Neobacillus citreus]
MLIKDETKIIEALTKAAPGIEKYQKIMDLVHQVDVSRDQEFQKIFNGFYRVRQRTPLFYETFFSFMERNKENPPSFEDTITYIYEQQDRFEASFSSKLVATLNPSMPIWDSVVLKNFGFKQPAYYKKNRMKEAIGIYTELINKYDTILKHDEGQMIIKLFDKV